MHLRDEQQYRGALCVAYPSLYEGFGIPVLEAMACGTPVVTSQGGATEEVAGGAAVLVDPLDVEAIAAGIEAAIGARDELSTRGLERARAYSWDETARRTLHAYEEAAAKLIPEGGILYLYHRTLLFPHTTRLEGYRVMPDGLIRVTDLRLK